MSDEPLHFLCAMLDAHSNKEHIIIQDSTLWAGTRGMELGRGSGREACEERVRKTSLMSDQSYREEAIVTQS